MTERFFINKKIEKDEKEILISDTNQIHQISKVLRKKQGDIIFILDNSGFEYECQIRQLVKKMLLLKIVSRKKNKNEPKVKVALYQSLIKKNKMEFVFEKCTEIGVSEFHPIISDRSVKLSLNKKRAETILKEATEQSQRGKIPELFLPEYFKKAINNISSDNLNIIFHEKSEELDFIDFLFKKSKTLKDVDKINLFIGPEGGFSEEEIDIATKRGFFVVSLGKRVLRSETASILSSGAILLFDK